MAYFNRLQAFKGKLSLISVYTALKKYLRMNEKNTNKKKKELLNNLNFILREKKEGKYKRIVIKIALNIPKKDPSIYHT